MKDERCSAEIVSCKGAPSTLYPHLVTDRYFLFLTFMYNVLLLYDVLTSYIIGYIIIRKYFISNDKCEDTSHRHTFLYNHPFHPDRAEAWSPRAIRINGWRYSGMLEADLVVRAVCSGFIHMHLGKQCCAVSVSGKDCQSCHSQITSKYIQRDLLHIRVSTYGGRTCFCSGLFRLAERSQIHPRPCHRLSE